MKLKNRFVCLVLLLVSLLTSCILIPSDPPSFVYRGENTALYSAANYSIIGMHTAESDDIAILEKDEYGRILFFVRASALPTYNNNKYIAAVLIVQSYDENTVSYYEGCNVLVHCFCDYFVPSLELVNVFFEESQISRLKNINDWGNAQVNDKSVTMSICTSDVDLKLVPQSRIDTVKNELSGDKWSISYDPMTRTKDGHNIYLFVRRNYGDREAIDVYIVIFDDDGYLCERVDDFKNCQDRLYELLRK